MTEHLRHKPDDILRAAQILRAGGLVAFPTETVYGLGADASNDHAVAKIYAAKGRPSFNPLIVHLADLAAVQDLVIWNDLAEALAQRFWPGPLTMVLPVRPAAPVSKLVTAGLATLAVRIPQTGAARDLLQAFGGGLAAPSANPSGGISPTTAAHVLGGLDRKIEAVVDGGACAVGLESTIVGLGETPVLLRPGAVTQTELSEVLGLPVKLRNSGDTISAPGQLASHYAPRAAVRLNATAWRAGEARLGFGPVSCDLNLSASADLTEAAANLFSHLHALDARGDQVIAVSPIPDRGLGLAINDRLARAAAPKPG